MHHPHGETLRSAFLRAWSRERKSIRLIDGHERWSFDDLATRALVIGRMIEEKAGAEPGHIGLMMPNSALSAATLFGIWLAERVAVPFNPALRSEELEAQIRDSQTDLILTSRPLRRTVPPFVETEPGIQAVVVEDYLGQALTVDATSLFDPEALLKARPEADPDRVACLIYTSGTTGGSKGVMLTHGNLLSNVASCHRRLGISVDDVYLCVLPIFHSFAMTATLLLPMLTGATTVMMGRFSPAEVLDVVAREQVSILLMVPPMYALALRALKDRPPEILRSARLCISGGGPLPPGLEEDWEKCTGHRLINGYGLSEASPVVAVNGPDVFKPGSAGVPLDDLRVEIWDDCDKPLPAGQSGHIVVRGPSVMRGYWKRPAESDAAFAEGQWLRTGDLGFLDGDGILTLTGRSKDLIIFGGENILPLEIENVLLQHPSVAEAAVIGRSDPVKGEVPIGCVVLRAGATVEKRDLRAFCLERLAEFKAPRDFVFLPALPRNTLGKVLKHQLKAALCGGG